MNLRPSRVTSLSRRIGSALPGAFAGSTFCATGVAAPLATLSALGAAVAPAATCAVPAFGAMGDADAAGDPVVALPGNASRRRPRASLRADAWRAAGLHRLAARRSLSVLTIRNCPVHNPTPPGALPENRRRQNC